MAGNWYRLPPIDPPTDPIEAEECNRDRVRQLLSRYGILFRELLQREQPLLQWRAVFRTLRLMEFSGEVVTGQFFTGVSGLQFMSHEAFESLRQGLDEDAVFWVNACDPASLCGTGIEGLKPILPSRLASNYVVYQGLRVVLVAQRNGKSLRCHVDPGHTRLPDYLAFFKVLIERDFHPLKRIVVETINNEPALQSPYLEDLKRFGFEKNVDRLELWKRYA
jgi:ATP-dependent Lhr-like helicase